MFSAYCGFNSLEKDYSDYSSQWDSVGVHPKDRTSVMHLNREEIPPRIAPFYCAAIGCISGIGQHGQTISIPQIRSGSKPLNQAMLDFKKRHVSFIE